MANNGDAKNTRHVNTRRHENVEQTCRGVKMKDWNGKCGTKLQGVKMQKGKKGARKVWNAVCQITFVGRL